MRAGTSFTDSRAFSMAARLFVFKVLYLLLVCAAVLFLPHFFNMDNYYANLHGPGPDPRSFQSFFTTWDSQNYILISEHGYRPGSILDAFYPLWPLCIRIFSYLTLGNSLAAGLILSNLLSVAALVVLHGYIAKRDGRTTADYSILLILAFPGGFYLLLPYSESLFLLLTAFLIVYIARGDYVRAGLVTFLAVLARPVGILLIVPLGLHILAARRYRSLGCLLIPLSGYTLYFAVMYMTTGDALAGFHAQDLFPVHPSVRNIFDVTGFIDKMSETFPSIGQIFFLWFIIAMAAVYKKDRDLFSLGLLMGLVPAMSNQLISFTRYALMVVPIFIVTASFFDRPGRKAWFFVFLAASFCLQIVLLFLHMNYYWVA